MTSPTAPRSPELAPEIDDDEARLAARLRIVVNRLHRRLRQQGIDDLTLSQTSTLATIEALGSPTLGEVAERERVRPPSMTRTIAALEEVGYVARVEDERDRRIARVALTAEGHHVLEVNRSLKTAYLASRLHRLSARERADLERLTRLLERLEEVDPR